MAKMLSAKEVESKRKNIDNIPKILAVVSPDAYSQTKGKDDLKGLKEKIKESPYLALDIAKGKADEEHSLLYDSSSETLEPIYFWILDMMNGMFGGKVKKIVDNFSSTVGSGHFSELQQKATRMQEEAMKIMGTVAGVVKGIINLVYDLKDFEVRFTHYDHANSTDPLKAQAGLLSLKQIWLDSVDVKRGNTSVKGMAAQFGYATLIDAFMASDSLEAVNGLDLNERVKKIVHQRIFEFLEWRKLSEVELRKRYNVEKTYLRNQINSLKMYTRWAKPYLRAAAQLEMKNFDDPSLVTAFNTILLQLTLLGRKEYDVDDALYQGIINKKVFKKDKLRKMYSCMFIDFKFRGIPERMQQGGYVTRGRTEVVFRGYTLNEDELKLVDRMLEETDINEALALAEGMTTESLEAIRKDLEYFLGPDIVSGELKEEEKKPAKKIVNINPFKDLFSAFSRGVKKDAPKEIEFGKIEKDNVYESTIRELATRDTKAMTFKVFSTYKKAHGMPAHKDPYE
jgi:hypothetical protein